ncbi:MAG: hypothetical protein ACREL7_19125 [Longimicrobiales bacterium]
MIRLARLPEGTRVRIQQGNLPLGPGVLGRTGTVVFASDYTVERLGVQLDGESVLRMFVPEELEVIAERPLPPEREAAKLLRALP